MRRGTGRGLSRRVGRPRQDRSPLLFADMLDERRAPAALVGLQRTADSENRLSSDTYT